MCCFIWRHANPLIFEIILEPHRHKYQVTIESASKYSLSLKFPNKIRISLSNYKRHSLISKEVDMLIRKRLKWLNYVGPDFSFVRYVGSLSRPGPYH